MYNFCIVHRIDKNNRIVYLSDEWQLFAIQNKAGHLTADAVLNKTLYEFISGNDCQHIYRMLIDRSRKNNETLRFPFRCDSPEKRRFMSMEIVPLEDESLEFISSVVREEPREPALLLDIDTEKSDEFVLICSWCKKIKIDEDYWVEVEEAIQKMNIFDKNLLPQLTHGICPVCYKMMV